MWFERLMLVVTIANVLLLALNNPDSTPFETKSFLTVLEIFDGVRARGIRWCWCWAKANAN